jgi:hypothetical protein
MMPAFLKKILGFHEEPLNIEVFNQEFIAGIVASNDLEESIKKFTECLAVARTFKRRIKRIVRALRLVQRRKQLLKKPWELGAVRFKYRVNRMNAAIKKLHARISAVNTELKKFPGCGYYH